MISIKDIAKEAGVSVATVSKALNDQSDISDATKEKIRKIADKLGYTINISARALKTNRTYNIGVLFANEHVDLSHEYFSLILGSFQREMEKEGYDITFINQAIAGNKTTYLKHVEYRSLDGVVIMTAYFHEPEIVELMESNIPVVCLDYTNRNCAAVLSDNKEGITSIVRYACENGHRKIAFIHGENNAVTRDRVNGFYDTCKEYGIKVPKEYVIDGNYHDIASCAENTKKLLQLEDRPTLIIFPDDYSYIGGMEALNTAGLSVPEDISAIGYDGINMAKIMNLTTYEQNTKMLGIQAARKLLQMINEPELPPEHVIVSGRLLEGSTVKNLNQ